MVCSRRCRNHSAKNPFTLALCIATSTRLGRVAARGGVGWVLFAAMAHAGTPAVDDIWWLSDQIASIGIHGLPATGVTSLDTVTSSLTWRQGSDGPLEGGRTHANGVTLLAGGQSFTLSAFIVEAAPSGDHLLVRDHAGQTVFIIRNGHAFPLADGTTIRYADADIVVSPVLAAAAGVPEHTHLLAGAVTLDLPLVGAPPSSAAAPSAGGSCTDGFGPVIDLALTDMTAISQRARDPGNRVALSVDAHLENIGIYDVRWYWLIAPNTVGNGTNFGPHPFLSQSYYRERDGVFRQIGLSDLKHAWNTVNGDCPCPGGQVMFVGCTDVYGLHNNANQFFFGPRTELTPHTGDWASLGSHFDATPMDDYRDHFLSEHDSLAHRLTVLESDLLVTGARFFVEAWYIAALETNIFDNIGYRQTTQTLSGAWAFSFVDSGLNSGPALNAWVNPAAPGPGAMNRVVKSPDGHFQVAVKTTPNGPGVTHYEYAVLNLDTSAGIQAFAVPRGAGVTVSAPGFNDTDHLAGNDWTVQVGADRVTWTAPANGQNDLAWGSLYNFRFDATAAPSTNLLLLNGVVQAVTLAPDTELDVQFDVVDFPAGGTTTWNAVSGAVYRVETVDHLSATSVWSVQGGPVTSGGVTATSPDPTAPADHRTFRIRFESLSP